MAGEFTRIEIAAPTPIVFAVGGVELRLPASVTVSEAFTLRHLLDGFEATSLEDTSFEEHATELHDTLKELFTKYGNVIEGNLPTDVAGLARMAMAIWRRSLGADDEELKGIGQAEVADGDDPPTARPNRATRRKTAAKPSTSSAGSAGSSRTTAARSRDT